MTPRGSVETATRAQRITLTVFFLLFSAVATVILFTGLAENRDVAALMANGKRVPGTIIDRYRPPAQRSMPYWMVVQYDVDGVPAQHLFYVTQSAFEGQYAGTRADVVYSPAHPLDVTLANGGLSQGGSTTILFSCVGIGIGLAAAAGCWIYWIRRGDMPD